MPLPKKTTAGQAKTLPGSRAHVVTPFLDRLITRPNVNSLLNDDTLHVGADDYIRWKTNFGQTSRGGGANTQGANVPEPRLVLMLLAGLATANSFRWNSKRPRQVCRLVA